MQDYVNLFTNTGVAIAVIIFFMYRDVRFMTTLQETLKALVDTVDSLKDWMKHSCPGGKEKTNGNYEAD